MGPDQPEVTKVMQVAKQEAFAAPFLMDELLALSAAHKSTIITDGAEKEMYRTESTRLQTRALARYSAVVAQEDQDPSQHLLVPIFLFSTFLGQHVLFDTFSFYNGNSTSLDQSLAAFLDQLVHCLGLHRGIAVVAGRSWPTLMSELRIRLGPYASNFSSESIHTNGSASTTTPAGRKCSLLRTRFAGDGADSSGRGSELSSASREACCSAVNVLQQMFDALPEPGGKGKQLFIGVQRWLVCVPADYINLLARRQPEALWFSRTMR
jgi:hypothetical protein